MNDQQAEFTVVTDKAKKVMTIERLFERDRDSMRTKGKYKLSVKACNPPSGCAGR